jgi:deoxyribonuclease-4
MSARKTVPAKGSSIKGSITGAESLKKRTAIKDSAPMTAAPARAKKNPNPLVPRRTAAEMADLPPLPQVPAGLRLGTHVSSQGGSFAAPPRATEIGATALQLFTKTPNQWKEREIDATEIAQFRAALLAAGSPVTVSHDSYLINLASPDDEMRARSIESFATELRRCHALGIQYLVSHPGNYMDDREAGIARNAAAISMALAAEPGDTILCLETTAGTGTALGRTFEELAAIIDAIPPALRARVGVCVDTCHIYSAGYDLVHDFDGVIAAFDRILGLGRLRVWHLNDSKTPFASHRDRHELIGEGSLGIEPFRRIMTDPRFAQTVRILETPKLDDATRTDRLMLNRLLALM